MSLIQSAINRRARVAACRAAGICTKCYQTPAAPPWRLCEGCRVVDHTRAAARYQRAREQGLCTNCYQPAGDRAVCLACASKQHTWKKHQRSADAHQRQMAPRSTTSRATQPRQAIAHVTHVAGYVPPKGSIAQQFLGRVIAPRHGQAA